MARMADASGERSIYEAALDRPIEIYDNTGSRIRAVRVFVVEISRTTSPSYALAFHDADGETLEWLQYDTLEIALDQAAELGIGRTEWSEIA